MQFGTLAAPATVSRGAEGTIRGRAVSVGMARQRKVVAGLSCAALAAVAIAVGSGPASAQLSTVTVRLPGPTGKTVTVTMDVPPGTPLGAIHPPVPGTVVSVVPNPSSGGPIPGVTITPPGSPPPAGPTTSSPPPSTSTPAPSGSGSGAPGQAPNAGTGTPSAGRPAHRSAPKVKRQRRQRTTGQPLGPASAPAPRHGGRARTPSSPAAALSQPNGVPTAANPTLSLAVPGAAPVGVPDFFIDKFRIPPFLLPIYQAAGTQYQVPWQVLAAINEIETDYGRDLSVSSAGAMGWMQFLPVEWKQWGVDATGTGVKDPFNPADAIFAAARYLHAAGASKSLPGAIFAYNHASWYVQSVLLRAKLIGGVPPNLLGAITGLTEGHFPVHARARYADDLTQQRAQQSFARTHNVAMPVGPNLHRTGINIYSRAGAAVIAVQDAKVVGLGSSRRLGHYLKLRDAYGNTYTYGQLKSIVRTYPVPKPQTESQAQVARDLAVRTPHPDAAPSGPATAGGHQAPAAPPAAAPVTPTPAPAVSSPTPADAGSLAQQALAHASPFGAPVGTPGTVTALPGFPATTATGGAAPSAAVADQGLAPSKSLDAYFADVYLPKRSDVVLRPLKVGSKVIAGTILGRMGAVTPHVAPHLLFQVRPAGTGSPLIDPKPVLDGWVLLERTSIYRAKGKNPFLSAAPSIGQVLLESKQQLTAQVLSDPNVQLYACGRRDIETGQIDQRVLATMEFLSASGLKPTVSALKCGHSLLTSSGNVSEHSSGNALDIAAVNGIPIVGHQGAGSITDITIRRLLTLQGNSKPHQIISLMTFPGTDNTLALPDHYDHIHVGFMPLYNADPRIRQQVDAVLRPNQWIKLIGRLGQISEPQVASKPSGASIPDKAGKPSE